METVDYRGARPGYGSATEQLGEGTLVESGATATQEMHRCREFLNCVGVRWCMAVELQLRHPALTEQQWRHIWERIIRYRDCPVESAVEELIFVVPRYYQVHRLRLTECEVYVAERSLTAAMAIAAVRTRSHVSLNGWAEAWRKCRLDWHNVSNPLIMMVEYVDQHFTRPERRIPFDRNVFSAVATSWGAAPQGIAARSALDKLIPPDSIEALLARHPQQPNVSPFAAGVAAMLRSAIQ